MSLNDYTGDIGIKAAGVLGAILSVGFIKGGPWAKCGLIVAGSALSIYVGPYIAERTGLPREFNGFLVGFFGMAILSKFMEFIQNTPIMAFWEIVLKWFQRITGG